MKLETGQRVKIEKNGTKYEGVILPRSEYESKSYVVLKLDNGYNIGLKVDSKTKISKMKTTTKIGKYEANVDATPKKNLPTIALLSTGGTIASRVDYRTGGVVPQFTSKDLLLSIPELGKLANLETEVVFEKLSENINTEDWQKLAQRVEYWINKGVDAVIIGHGTDTMQYTANALSFMIQDPGIPIILVGSQRSSDRPSTDAAINILSATYFGTTANASGVFVCMHEKMDDDYCSIHKGTRVRKMHSSRRDAFKSINTKPLAKVLIKTQGENIKEKKITWNEEPRTPRKKHNVKAETKLENKVALIKAYPGITEKDFSNIIKGKKGIVLEGTGLGHVPSWLIPAIKKAKDTTFMMTTQTINGRVNMNVYENGRDLLHAGVISARDMTPATTFVKLMWALANSKKPEKTMQENLVGEVNERTTTIDF